jgi:hypothetical protein
MSVASDGLARRAAAIANRLRRRTRISFRSCASTYVQTAAIFTATTTHEWNHGLGEIVTALFAEGLQITGLVEHDSVPWEALPGQMAKDDGGEWRLTDRPWRLAASYTLQAVKSRACDHLSPFPHAD